MKCKICGQLAHVALASHNAAFCASCYRNFFSRQVSRAIEGQKLFSRGEKVLVALSGGKDSLALMLELSRQEYDVTGLFVDLAIPVSSDQARAVVERFCSRHGLRLLISEAAPLGLAIPEVKKALRRPVCSACGAIKRHLFNRAARQGGFAVLATGHNLDDEVARLFSNVLRFDSAHLAAQAPLLPEENGFPRKVRPLWRLTEFETANYAFIMGIEHHHAPCPYSAGASFSFLKGLLQRLERQMPGRKLDFYQSFLARGRPAFAAEQRQKEDAGLSPCPTCGEPSSAQGPCSVCRMAAAVAAKKAGSQEAPDDGNS